MLAGNIALRLAVTLSSQLFGFYGVLALNAMCGVIALAAMPWIRVRAARVGEARG